MVRRILTAFTLASIALFAFGQERFVIERIEVRNAHRVSPRVIVDETTLREGKEYSEEDVRAGVARVNRLPFLLSADFALEKGTQDGRRVLVINVTEMRRLSFLVDARGLLGDTIHRTLDYDFDRPGESNDAAAARWFAGDRGMLHFTMAVRRGRQSFMRPVHGLGDRIHPLRPVRHAARSPRSTSARRSIRSMKDGSRRRSPSGFR